MALAARIASFYHALPFAAVPSSQCHSGFVDPTFSGMSIVIDATLFVFGFRAQYVRFEIFGGGLILGTMSSAAEFVVQVSVCGVCVWCVCAVCVCCVCVCGVLVWCVSGALAVCVCVCAVCVLCVCCVCVCTVCVCVCVCVSVCV
jgi:hypothetical protein